MAAHATLVPVKALATLLRITIDSQDPYALMVLTQASNTVRSAAREPGWVRVDAEGDLGPGQSEVPSEAQDITVWLAMRAYNNPRNLERRTAGPISESFRDTGVYGLELTPDERSRLARLGSSGSTGFWVQPLAYGDDPTPVLAPSMTSYGVTDLGPTYFGTSDQFPYNDNEG